MFDFRVRREGGRRERDTLINCLLNTSQLGIELET